MTTLDGMAYNFQAVGEFISARSVIDDLEIQGRMEQMRPQFEDFTILTAMAMNVAGDVVVVKENASPPYEPSLQVNGMSRNLPEAGGDPITLSGGGTINRSGQVLVIRWPDGAARVDVWQRTGAIVTGDRALATEVMLSDQYIGNVRGLLGTMDGNSETDFTTRAGTVLAKPLSFEELYRDFGDSWRIEQEESLFGTPTFADLSIPSQQVTTDDLDPSAVQDAEAACQDRGVTDPALLENCVFDLVMSGNSTFVEDAAQLIGQPESQMRDLVGANEAKIQIVLRTRPADGRDFTFRASDAIGDFTLSDAGEGSALDRMKVLHPLAPGTYEIRQEQPSEGEEVWSTNVSCSPEEEVAVGDTSATITLAGGHSVRCTFMSVLDQLALDIRRDFEDASNPEDYRLVALPGQVNRPLGETVEGEAGTQWQAFWDNGSEEDFFRKFDGSETFRFRPGRGFWLTSMQSWTVTGPVETLSLDEEETASISLHDGWNIVSNPLSQDVAWSAVEEANDGALQPAWAFDGSFRRADTFRSAATGQAYYFLNDQGLDSLKVLLPGASRSNEAILASATDDSRGKTSVESTSMRLIASRGDSLRSAVSVGIGLEEGASTHDVVAPPTRFSGLSLRLVASGEAPSRRRYLAAEHRSPTAETEGGHTFDLRLQNETEGPVQIDASDLEVLDGREVVLIEEASGESHDLRATESVTINQADSTALRLAVGSEAFVEDQRQSILPNEVSITSYPNPFRSRATLEYTLPEASEVRIEVYDMLGRRVAVLEDGQKQAGRHTVEFDGTRLSSGVYFGRLETEGETRTRKITVVR